MNRKYYVTHGYFGTAHPVAAGVRAWQDYARQYARRYDALISDDACIGSWWAVWGQALRKLLNGETGAMDCGAWDALIVRVFEEHGFREDGAVLHG